MRSRLDMPRVLYGLTLGAYLGSLIWVGTRAPARVASHFGAGGLPDAWLSRGQFVTVFAVLGGLFLLVVPVIGLFAGRLPASVVNVPNRDYWLAPQNRPDLAERVLADVLVISCLTAWLVLLGMLGAVQATIQDTGMPGWMTRVLIGYLVLVAGYVGFMLTIRYRPPDRHHSGTEPPG